MTGKLLLGSAFIVVGFILAVFGVASTTQPAHTRDASPVIVGDQAATTRPLADDATSMPTRKAGA